MTRAEIQRAVEDALQAVAPEVDPAGLKPDAALRDQVELDSMDFLRYVIALHERVGLDIPEADYPKLGSLTAAVDYLVARVGGAQGANFPV